MIWAPVANRAGAHLGPTWECCLVVQSHYPEYESNFGIDHSRIVDLLQVFDISPTIDVSVIGNER